MTRYCMAARDDAVRSTVRHASFVGAPSWASIRLLTILKQPPILGTIDDRRVAKRTSESTSTVECGSLRVVVEYLVLYCST